jgi:4-hydroxythreonine-4-phosphate dehydrogenase
VPSPILLFTQGDPAGIGPELILSILDDPSPSYRSVVVAERSALDAVRTLAPASRWDRLDFVDATVIDRDRIQDLLGRPPARSEGTSEISPDRRVLVLDPVAESRPVVLGVSGPADAAGAMAALDLGSALAREGVVDALVTLPISKASIADHVDSTFRGHTDYLAAACGLERYGRDYLMVFLAPALRVALLTVHQPLRQALDEISSERVLQALLCLHRHVDGSIALAGLNPHAGEGGMLGGEEREILEPAVELARAQGVPVQGPLSADSLFARARSGAFDWVLALYHDQGLIAVKTAEPASSTNWTLGLPYLRTSVDHGTAFDIAGRGVADATSLRSVIATTLDLIAGEAGGLLRRSPPGS